MTYIVQQVDSLYVDEDKSEQDEIAEFLNANEAQGFRLVGILPDHQHWDENGMPEGRTATMLILHKDEPGTARILA